MTPLSCRYPLRVIWRDYLRAVIGLTTFGAPALFVAVSSVMFWLLGGLALLFAAFGIRTAIRHTSRVVVDGVGIRFTGLLHRSVTWNGLGEVRIRYYSTWRDRSAGWMQLVIKGGGTTIRVDQTLDGFKALADTVCRGALANGARLDGVTRHNAGAIGLDLPTESGDEQA